MAILRATANTVSDLSLGSNIIEVLSSPCNGTAVTVPSGTYTVTDVTSVQSMSESYVDVTGSSINYTPPSGTTRVKYKFIFHAQYDGSNYTGMHIKFFLDGTEVSDARRTIYGYLSSMTEVFEYTINCSASGANTAHGDITSWTSAKIMKLQAREYNSGNQCKLNQTSLWDGAGTNQFIIPSIEITSFKDS